MSTTNHSAKTGFTLVEMMVVAPLVILLIGGLIAALMSMTSKAMITQARNQLAYSVNDALNTIEQDTQLSHTFLTSSGNLPANQGGNNAFSSSSSLILENYATTKNPLDTSRQLVYYANQPNLCADAHGGNVPFSIKIIYFVKNGALWRRVAVPSYRTSGAVTSESLCEAPWQRNSCPSGCASPDSKLVEGVDSFTVKYLEQASDTSTLPASSANSASALDITIKASQTAAAKKISSDASIITSKANSSN